MKKLTYEFVKEQFEKEGYELLSREYVNSKQKLKYRCPEGHAHSIIWSDWNYGCRCYYCGIKKVSDKKRMDIGFIKAEFEKKGYQLLTKEYINSKQKLEYICPNEHRHGISWSNWCQGKRCPYCARNGKPTIEFIKLEFAKEGYKLLTEEYVNSSQKLDYICPEWHEHAIRWNDWRSGYRCSTCFFINNSGSGNSNWKGGISCEPYCDIWTDKEYKKSILERDNYKCQNPDCWGTMPDDLTIHHIDYNKKNCGPNNLITLCRSCNSRANYDRKWHKMFYRVVMEKRNKIKKFVMGL